MALNFADIAGQKLEEIERPPLAPVGTYKWRITKLPETVERESDKGHWDVVNFAVTIVEPTEDVDPDQLEAFGPVNKVSDRLSFMFDKNDDNAFNQTKFQLRRFLEEHVQCAEPSNSLAEAINNSVNGEFLAVFSHREDKRNPGTYFGNIGKTAPVE